MSKRSRLRSPTLLAIATGLLLSLATVLMLLGIEPFATWYYLFAWYSYLVLLDAFLAARGVSGFVFDRPKVFLSLWVWSAVFWFAFEIINLRIRNWYYVFLPDALPVRWLGTVASFATILPGIFGTAMAMKAAGLFGSARSRPLAIRPGLLRAMSITGWTFLALPLAWPEYFFPLVWGASALIVAPRNYRASGPCLLRDLEAGDLRRLLRLLAAGLLCGLLWEAWNVEARAKWIYTVPFVGDLRLFEMPMLGFLGFPPFALECYELYRATCRWGVALDFEESEPSPITRRFGPLFRFVALPLGAAGLSLLALLGMDRFTVASLTPRVRDLAAIPPIEVEALEARGASTLFDLFYATRALGPPPASAAGAGEPPWMEMARLATFRGIGTGGANALAEIGVKSTADLASQDPRELFKRLHAVRPRDMRLLLVRVEKWVSEAQRLTEREILP